MFRVCVAPLSTPAVVPNATLISLFLFTRHGARTPTYHAGWPRSQGEWHCGGRYADPNVRIPLVNGHPTNFGMNSSSVHKYPPTCIDGALLDRGFDQMKSLGAFYRPYLVDDTSLLPDRFLASRVHVHASWLRRSHESALAFFEGLYPPSSPGETLNIEAGDRTDAMVPGINLSDDWDGAVYDFVDSSPDLQLRLQSAKKLYTPLLDRYNVSSRTALDYLTIADLFHPYRCGNGELSEMIDDALFERMLSDMAAVEFGYISAARNKTCARLKTMVLRELDAQFAQEKAARFTLFSGHDLTLVTVLAGIGYKGLKIVPQYAAHLALEIWHSDRPYVRFVFNGDVIPVRGKELLPLSEYREMQ
jgi:hypothetical protein